MLIFIQQVEALDIKLCVKKVMHFLVSVFCSLETRVKEE